jgi:hypothetical protein
MELRLFEESGNVMIVEPVLDLVVFPTDRPHKPAITQQPELVGYRGLPNANRDGEITYAQRPPGQRIKDLGSGGIA